MDSPSTAQHTVRSFSDIASGMANPTILHMLKIKRLGRYLLKHPPEIWEFEYQETPKSVCVMSDSDRATCKTSASGHMSSMPRTRVSLLLRCRVERQSSMPSPGQPQ